MQHVRTQQFHRFQRRMAADDQAARMQIDAHRMLRQRLEQPGKVLRAHVRRLQCEPRCQCDRRTFPTPSALRRAAPSRPASELAGTRPTRLITTSVRKSAANRIAACVASTRRSRSSGTSYPRRVGNATGRHAQVQVAEQLVKLAQPVLRHRPRAAVPSGHRSPRPPPPAARPSSAPAGSAAAGFVFECRF